MSKTLLRYVAPFTVEYWIVATSTTDFAKQLLAILTGHTSKDDAVRVAWPNDTLQYTGYAAGGGAMYLPSKSGITEPSFVPGTAILASDAAKKELFYITKGDYAGKVMSFISNVEQPYTGYLLRSDTNLIKTASDVVNFTLIAYNSAGEIEATLDFKCLAGTTWQQFVASGENTAELEVTGNYIEYPGTENYYTITRTDGGTDNILKTDEIVATTYYCHWGW